MKKVKLSLIALSVMFIFAGGMLFTSCEKTELEISNENEGLENGVEGVQAKNNIQTFEDYLYSSTKIISEKASDFEVEYILHTDNKDNINAELIFEPVYKRKTNNVELTNLRSEKNVILKEEYTKADISIELVSVTLPENAIGVSLKYGNRDKGLIGYGSGIMEMWAYEKDGFKKGYVEFLNDESGTSWVKGRIGVLWKPNSWFYDYSYDKMTHEGEYFEKGYSNFYKIAARAKHKNASAKLEIYK